MEEKYEQIEFESETAENEETAVSDSKETAEAVETAEVENKAEESHESAESENEAAESHESAESEAKDSKKAEESDAVTESEENAENTETAEISENVGNEVKSESEEDASAEESSDGEKKRVSRKRAAKNDGEQSDGSEAAIAPEKMPKAQAMRVLEAIMFANGDEVYYDQFAKIIGYTVKEAKKIVDAYAKMYDSGSMPRGIRFVKYEKCCQLTTSPDLGEYVTQMIGIRGEPQLSAAAMETLAIVAYNQPVTRAYIEQVRRVDSTRPIAVLLDRELIEEKGRLDVIGRPRLFGTTQNFLRTFGITSLEALPSLDLFAVEG